MPGLRCAAVAEGNLARANIGRLIGLGVNQASLGLPERHGLSHAEAGPSHVAALLDRECQVDEILSTVLS